MITNILPYIFGTVSFFGGLYLFLLSYRIYRPKHKTQEQELKFENWLTKFGTISKVCSIILILNGGYDLIVRDSDRYRINHAKKIHKWTIEDKEILIKNCIRDSKTTGIKYPHLIKEYCECSTINIMESMTNEEYLQSIEKTQREQMNNIMPIIQDCLNNLKHKIDSVNTMNNNK
jgi:ATP-dependent Lon protease